jgi:hypothetical protein
MRITTLGSHRPEAADVAEKSTSAGSGHSRPVLLWGLFPVGRRCLEAHSREDT